VLSFRAEARNLGSSRYDVAQRAQFPRCARDDSVSASE
jgi:hypothetical protein